MKILFITWDGPQASYMEGLFIPIFNQIKKKNGAIEFHILQFTWDNDTRLLQIKNEADKYGFIYTSYNVIRYPNVLLGSTWTIWSGAKFISDYLTSNAIDVIMPRSTMPALMTNIIKNRHKKLKIVFDADGLPLEERIEEGSLKKGGMMHAFLEKQEKIIVKYADSVLVRAEYAIDYYINKDKSLNRENFFKVTNGRDPARYAFNEAERVEIRKQLNINNDSLLLIYVGSLGRKYSLIEMIYLYKKIKLKRPDTNFLILTPSMDYINSQLNSSERENLIIKSATVNEVSRYLSAADIAFCLINQTLSMKSVAATKLGEYFLAGLPVIATSKIGDVDFYLENHRFCFLLDNYDEEQFNAAASWACSNRPENRKEIATFGSAVFSIEASAQFYLKALNNVLETEGNYTVN